MGTFGRLGNGSDADQNTPIQVTGLTNAVGISAGVYHSCAVASNSAGWCWGRGGWGELGDGSASDLWTPVQVSE